MAQLTVFTPTYNRRNLLTECYLSVINQTYTDFVWLIVDDGSTDGTKEMVENWITKTKKPIIQYIYKNNGGLHTAYNTAIKNINTELSVCIDSDDLMPLNAVERILTVWNEIGNDSLAGIVGLDISESGDVLGDLLPNRPTINLIDLLTNKYNIKNGDRTNVVRSSIYKSVYPMPTYNNEKNFNPHYMHIKISMNYDFYVLNEPIRIVRYQDDGMSASIFKQYKDSPRSFLETRKLYLSLQNTSLKFRLKNIIHLYSSAYLLHDLSLTEDIDLSFFERILCKPAGYLLKIYINIRSKA